MLLSSASDSAHAQPLLDYMSASLIFIPLAELGARRWTPLSLLGMTGGEGATLAGSRAHRMTVEVESGPGWSSAAEW